MAKGKNQHGWLVKGEGNSKATAVTSTIAEAIVRAESIDRNQNLRAKFMGIMDKLGQGIAIGMPPPPKDKR
jgi:hypothetical protein